MTGVQTCALPIFDRWLRWFVFAFGAAQICVEFEWIDRPFWVLATVFFIVWFFGETVYNWMLITAESLSPLPLFPRYVLNTSGEEWPVQPRLLKVREWLKSQGFRQVQALKAEIGGGIFLRASVYQDGSGTVRVQVTFLPQANGVVAVCYGVTSVTADGTRYVTDNLYIPFGGFFPENWLVERSPWRRSMPALIQRHRARLAAAGLRGRCLIDFARLQVLFRKEVPRLIETLGPESVAFGSHLPFDYVAPSLVKLDSVARFHAPHHEAIAWRNAARFLRLE